MKKIYVPTTPEEERYIFTEGINYFSTGEGSIWGAGDDYTLKILERIQVKGKWLNLASGDGRYNSILLSKADFVTASDIDEGALSKLWHGTPEKFRHKLKTVKLNITEEFPFDDMSFDGIFCTGTLHLFPNNVLGNIVSEIGRVLKPKGRVIIDFATEIKRTSPEGKVITFGKEPLYNFDEAKALLRSLFRNYSVEMHDSEVVEEFQAANPPYKLSCRFIVMIADKN